MRKINPLACLAIVLFGTTLINAQATRTWVSGVGDDANPCSRTAPCKTFAGAISKTAPGGEIDALDPGGFGALTITKSITLDGGGGQVASVLVAGTNGIVVAAGPGDIVIIRNMRLDGLLGGGNANAGINGINFISGKDLNIENCVIFGFAQNGILTALNQNTQATVHIINTIIKNNGADGIKSSNAQTPPVQVAVDNSQIMVSGQNGVEGGQHSRTAVRNSYIHTATVGVKGNDTTSTDAQMEVDGTVVTNMSSDAIQANTGSTVVPGTITAFYNGGCGFNGTGGGSVVWWQNTNHLGANTGGNVCGTNTPVPQI